MADRSWYLAWRGLIFKISDQHIFTYLIKHSTGGLQWQVGHVILYIMRNALFNLVPLTIEDEDIKFI